MWNAKIESLKNELVKKVEIHRQNQPLRFDEVLELWRESADFRRYFTGVMNDCPYPAFRWETPRVTSKTVNRKFEFVLINQPALQRPVDQTVFADHFDSKKEVVAFPNLGRNAILVVPCPVIDSSHYGHLAAFLRNAPLSQIDAFWIAIAHEMKARIGAKPVWLSTAGMGVSWLHVRLDDRPKYYGHAPYREIN